MHLIEMTEIEIESLRIKILNDSNNRLILDL